MISFAGANCDFLCVLGDDGKSPKLPMSTGFPLALVEPCKNNPPSELASFFSVSI